MFRRIIILLFISVLLSQAPDWDCDGDELLDNLSSYANSGSFTAGVLLDNINEVNEGDMFAAFVSNELRGIGSISSVPDVPPVFGQWAGQNQFTILIYSNEASGETLTFKYYDSETDAVYDISDTYEFISDMYEGDAVEPVVFNFESANITEDSYESCVECEDEDEDDICDDVDDCVGAYDECGDCNGDGIDEGACDCDGNVLDECGECGGDGINEGACDCDGNVLDECGECGGDGINEGACDCEGNVLDECGVCDGPGLDCDGACNENVELWGECYNIETTTYLNLYDEYWYYNYDPIGPIPPEIGQLVNLVSLNLSYTLVSGEIPPEIGNLVNLEMLNLDRNYLTGAIPSEIGQLTNLDTLKLGYNQFTSIPIEISNLENLRYFRLTDNEISGDLPSEIGELVNLRDLELGSNQITSVPESVGNLDYLFNLNLGGNQLTALPSTIGDLDSLGNIYLSDNHLTEFPLELSNIENLYTLHLWGNQIIGEIPPEIGNFSQLYKLSLGYNQLTGEIPSQIGELNNLRDLDLTANNLTGPIPPSVFNCSGYLALSDNQFSGELTDEMFDQHEHENSLDYNGPFAVELDENELSGVIPQSICNIVTGADWVELGGNAFCPPYPSCYDNTDYTITNEDEQDVSACQVATLSLGAFDSLGTLEVLYDFGSSVAGFQFDVSGLALTGGSGGAAGDAGFDVQTGSGTVLGFSLTGGTIPAGTGVLTILSFADITSGSTELSLGNFGAVTSSNGSSFNLTVSGSIDHGDPDCVGDYYTDLVEDQCGTCDDIIENDCIQDCEGTWGGTVFEDCAGVCGGNATYDICGECNGNGSSCGLLDGHLNQESGWNFYQSSQIGFYGFQEVLIEGSYAIGDGWAPSSNANESECVNNPYSCDVVGAFLNGVCVGWVYADSGGETTVPVMGYDNSNATSSQQTQGYCTESDTPIFLIFDSSDQETYLLDVSPGINQWSQDFYVYDSAINSYAEIGCTNNYADNFDPDAVIDDGSCTFTQSLSFDQGWNMFSLNLLPSEASLFDILSPIHSDMLLVLDETGAAIFQDQAGVNWYDNIGLWLSTEGYLMKMQNSAILDITSNQNISLPFTIGLSKGWNVISYPIPDSHSDGSPMSNLVENVLESLLENEFVELMFDEAGNVYIPDYITGGNAQNSIISMTSGNAYYLKVSDDSELSIYLPENEEIIVENNIITQNRDAHFTPIWSGNPFTPMTIIVDVASWNLIELSEGDEIGVFDGDLCVGAYIVPDEGFVNNSGAQIVTSMDDISDGINGFINGNEIKIRIWRNSIEKDVDATIVEFTDESGNLIDPVFKDLSAPSIELNVYPPSASSQVSISTLTEGLYLQWSRPEYGDYMIYEDDNTTYNAINFEISRDGSPIQVNLINNSYVDETTNYNTEYIYQISSVSLIDFDVALSSEYDALTRPGIPTMSYSSNVNSINLNWFDSPGSGSDSQIDYLLEREWTVVDENYDIIINNIFDQNYSDQGLLNNSAFGYKVRAHNNSGYSGWSEEIIITTLPYNNSLTAINMGDIISTVTQNIIFPDNEIVLDWVDVNNAESYRVYDRNLLLSEGEVSTSEFVHDGLENSTLHQYSITSIDSNGESQASSILELTTLPEVSPAAPLNLVVNSNQNSMNLDWEHVTGYGPPIGGEANIYRIYRFDLENFNLDNLDNVVHIDESDISLYTDFNLEDNMNFCYAVSGVNSEGLEGEKSSVVCNTTQNQLPVAVPVLNLEVNNRDVYLSWEQVSGSSPITYQIYKQEKNIQGDILYSQYLGETSNTDFSDNDLGRGVTYFYFITARNELGISLPSNEESVFIAGQTSRLAATIPINLENLNDNLEPRTSSTDIPDFSELNWDPATFTNEEADDLFYLSFEGNPYSPMSIIVNELMYNGESIPDGSIVAVFDGELCVGKGITPLPFGQLSVSANDGSGNGFSGGNEIYFRVWNSTSGNILTAYENPPLTFSQLGLEYTSINIQDDKYKLYRNGNLLVQDLVESEYNDSELEGSLDYYYRASAYNNLEFETDSNLSEGDQVNTDAYPGNPPEFDLSIEEYLSNINNTTIQEDNVFNVELIANDIDGDVITYFAQPINSSDPIACFVDGNNLQVIPAPDYFGSFDIAVYAFDDIDPGYESNTYYDQLNFTLIVESINDPPVRLNYFEDLVFPIADFCDSSLGFYCPYVIDVSSYIVDVDQLLMNEENLFYTVETSSDIVNLEVISNNLNLNFVSVGSALITLTATDISGQTIEDTFYLTIEEILEAEDLIPSDFKLNDIYPNPFNPTAYFNVDIPYNTMLRVDVYNILGQKVENLYNGFISAGSHGMFWSPKNAPSGIYLLQMRAESFTQTNKMILLK